MPSGARCRGGGDRGAWTPALSSAEAHAPPWHPGQNAGLRAGLDPAGTRRFSVPPGQHRARQRAEAGGGQEGNG